MREIKLSLMAICYCLVFSMAALATDVFFDESTTGVTIKTDKEHKAYRMYASGATPDDGSSPNTFYLEPGCVIIGTVSLEPEVTYNAVVRRMVNSTGRVFYSCKVGNNVPEVDAAIPEISQTEDGWYEMVLWHPYRATSKSVTITLQDAGPWAGRVDYVKFTPSPYTYFNIDTPDIVFEGNSWQSDGEMRLWTAGDYDGDGGEYSKNTAGVIKGTVKLKTGVTYNVYIRRFTRNGDQCQFKIDIGGKSLITDYANNGNTDIPHVEWKSDTYTATESDTAVKIYDGGPYLSRVDYIRFEEQSVQ